MNNVLVVRPLSEFKPIFFGSGIPISSYAYPRSLVLPPITTIAGTFFTLLYHEGFEPGNIISMVEKGSVKIKGVFTSVSGDRLLAPIYYPFSDPCSPSTCLKSIINDAMKYERSSGEEGRSVFVSRVGGLDVEILGSDILQSCSGEMKFERRLGLFDPKGRLYDVFDIEYVYENRIGIKIDHRSRAVPSAKDPYGRIYNYYGLSRIVIRDYRGRLVETNPSYASIITSCDEKISETLKKIMRSGKHVVSIGGKQGIGLLDFKEYAPGHHDSFVSLNDYLKNIEEDSNTKYASFIAVSHIPLRVSRDKSSNLVLRHWYTGHRLAAFYGEICGVTGWDIYRGSPKPIIPAIMPGTIFTLSLDQNNRYTYISTGEGEDKYWWIKLLDTVIPLNKLRL